MTPVRLCVPVVLAACVLAASCAGSRPKSLGVHESLLGECPTSPNCVSSETSDAAHAIPAFTLEADSTQGWRAVREAVVAMPRTTIVTETATYLHAECASSIFGFVDDLELLLRGGPGQHSVIAVRSASRVGYSDMGVNRKRVELLRQELAQRGVITIDTGHGGD